MNIYILYILYIYTVGKQINAKPYYLLTTLLYARWENK